jgi:sigma-B regulation protein RsbU (phosphoserine phosphatase)
MATNPETVVREQLLDRRHKLERALTAPGAGEGLTRLLAEVDAALGRLDDGSYGLCEVCHEGIEADRLMADPLVRFCLGHLTPDQQRVLEEDLGLTARIQQNLLPDRRLSLDGWEVAYHYEPAGPVSGDYCDVIMGEGGACYFIIGDVSGKGVAASMMMAHLRAMFRSLISVGLSLDQLVERVNRLFCESVLPMHYATLICGKADAAGRVEICNAGHPPLLVLKTDETALIRATGVPVGMFCSGEFTPSVVHLAEGDALLLYTDGVVEARNHAGDEYGVERLLQLGVQGRSLSPGALVGACLEDVAAFRAGARLTDDLTIMAIRRGGPATGGA